MEVENNQSQQTKTVLSAKLVDLALVSYIDNDGAQHTQLCIVGEHNTIMLDGRALGYSKTPDPGGMASPWLHEAAKKALQAKGKK